MTTPCRPGSLPRSDHSSDPGSWPWVSLLPFHPSLPGYSVGNRAAGTRQLPRHQRLRRPVESALRRGRAAHRGGASRPENRPGRTFPRRSRAVRMASPVTMARRISRSHAPLARAWSSQWLVQGTQPAALEAASPARDASLGGRGLMDRGAWSGSLVSVQPQRRWRVRRGYKAGRLRFAGVILAPCLETISPNGDQPIVPSAPAPPSRHRSPAGPASG